MTTTTYESNKKTLDDAIDALDRLEAVHNLDESLNVADIRTFLSSLRAKAEPLTIATDYDGFILEGALQHGFDTIDDDIELYVVSGAKLIDFIKLRRAPNTSRPINIHGHMVSASEDGKYLYVDLGTGKIHIKFDDEGVVVDIWSAGDAPEVMGSTYATFAELEPE